MNEQQQLTSDSLPSGQAGDGQPGLATTQVPPDKLPIGALAQMDYDKSLLWFGIVPLLAVMVVALIYAVLYYYRRGRSWNELGQAMRDEETDHNQKDAATPFADRDPPKRGSATP